jgi:hypothetical protein
LDRATTGGTVVPEGQEAIMNVTRCLAVMDRADEMAVQLYEQALEIADGSRVRTEDYAVLLEDSADVIRELAGALRVAAFIVLQKAEASNAIRAAADDDERANIAQ